MGLGHAYRKVSPTLAFKSPQLTPGFNRPTYCVGAVNLLGQGQHLILGGRILRIGVGYVSGGGGHFGQRFGQVGHTGSALGKTVGCYRVIGSGFHGNLAHRCQLFWAIGVKAVDCHNHRDPKAADNFHVVGQVRASALYGAGVGLLQFTARDSAVPFQGANRGYQDHGMGQKPALPRFNMHKLFKAQVRPKTGFGYHVVGVGQSYSVRDD